jgi:Cys-tRNA(Pro)/Cys-tRNA(Cys) deacylase
MGKNNIIRLLESKNIPFQAYDLPPVKLGAMETAKALNIDPTLVYKTIVVRREHGKPILAVIPGPHRLELKLLASALGEKKLLLPTEREAEEMTGLQAGGISPLALINKGFQVVIASDAEALPQIHISGGQRGLNIKLPVQSLAELTHACFFKINVHEE